MELTFWRFLLFLGAELLFLIAALAGAMVLGLMIIRKRAIKGRYVFVVDLTSVLLSTLFLALFTWILTGKGHTWLFGVIAVVSIILILLVELMWLIFGASDVPWAGRRLWTVYEFQRLLPRVNLVLQSVGALTLLIFPIYIGIGFFGDASDGADWPKYVLRGTLVLLIGVGWLVQIPSMLYVITSRNLMEGSRSRLFMTQLGGSASLLVLMSVFIWAMDSEGKTVPLLGEYFVFSPTVGYAVGAYFLFVLVVPYLIGHYRAKRWAEHLNRDMKALVDTITTGLGALSLEKATGALDESATAVQAKAEDLHSTKSMALMIEVAQSESDELLLQRLALQEGTKYDPRLLHLERLGRVAGLVDECGAELSTKEEDAEKRDVLTRCTALLKQVVKEDTLATSSTKAWVLIALTSLATSMASPVLSAVGKFITAKLGFGG